MFDAEIGLDKGDSISLKLAGGSLFVWNNKGRVLVCVYSENKDTLRVVIDDETMKVLAVTSPRDRIRVPIKSWQEFEEMFQ